MSAEKTKDEKPGRKRRFGLAAAEEPVEMIEADDELDDDDTQGRGLTAPKGRVTPGRRSQEIEEAKDEGNFVTRPIRGIGEYIEGVRSEVSKVAWPTREEARRLSTIVLVTTIIAAIALGVISFLLNELFIFGLGNPWVFVGILAVVVGIGIAFYVRSNRSRSSDF